MDNLAPPAALLPTRAQQAANEMLRAPVAITGIGAVSALGLGTRALLQAMQAGRDGIRRIDRFSTEGFSVHTAALVPGYAGEDVDGLPERFAIDAAREAIVHAGLEGTDIPRHRIGFIFGTSLATHPEGVHRIAQNTADVLGAHGIRATVSTACASSANALGLGRDLLLEGAADVVIAGGSDALPDIIFAGFHNLGLLAPEKCAPFSEPTGTTLGEGAGFCVLETAEHARRRGAAPIGWVSGYGLSCDAYHATSPDPQGAGVTRAMRGALSDAGLLPSAIDYVNAHATGTEANDPAEWHGIRKALGRDVPVSASKSFLGHGQGAAGVLEIIATLLAMQHACVPQTLRFTRQRPRCPADPVAQAAPRPLRVAHALCNSSAFGGANAVVAIDSADSPAAVQRRQRRPVWVAGAGAVSPAGTGIHPVCHAIAAGRLAGRAAALQKPPAGIDVRGFDPLALLLVTAAADALSHAGLLLKTAVRDRIGLFASLVRISPASARELDESRKERGLARISAPAFTRVVLNAATGACARALGLRGPTTTVTVGEGSGLFALAYAAMHLATHEDADTLLVAGADEFDPGALGDDVATFCESGACLVLTTVMPARGPRIRVAGYGFAGPGRGGDALHDVLAANDWDEPIDPFRHTALHAPSCEGLYRTAAAFVDLCEGRARRAAVVHNPLHSGTAAVVLEACSEEHP